MRWSLIATLACFGSLLGCEDHVPAPCQCTPANSVRTKRAGDAQPIGGPGLLAMLRKHRQLLAEDANRRDVKMVDDEIRIVVTEMCQPCGAWVGDRTTIEELFPLALLDDATGAVCLGLVLRDGTTAFGGERPAACR
jgi:hypothetical protein